MKPIRTILSTNEAQVVAKDRGKLRRTYQEITTSQDATELFKLVSKEFKRNNVAVIILSDARK